MHYQHKNMNMAAIKMSLVYLAIGLSWCEAYKILVVFPMPSKSHGILGDGLVKHLIEDGHDVTYISPFPYKPESPKVHVIDVSRNFEILPSDLINIESILNKKVDMMDVTVLFPFMINVVNFTIHNENVQKLLNDPNEQFDLVLVEWMFSDLLSSFSAIYNCPYIWSSSLDIHWLMLRLIDEPTNPAYSADIQSANIPPFTFWQRVAELYTQTKLKYYRFLYFDKMENEVYENSVAPIIAKRGRQPPSYHEIQYNASLVLANTHISLGEPISIPHNFISIAGYHIEPKVKPLPEDLKKILDNAKHGVIYFSMGSNLKSKDIPVVLKHSLLKMFGELKQTVLWKFEENLPNTPKNVHIIKWAPQQSILAHPNTVLFITHGGLLSTTETVNFGVPIIGIPVFADQFINVARSVKRGFAAKVDLSYDMTDMLKAAIEEMTTNPRYTQKVKELSFIYHDRLVTPDKQIQHWVRHVIETRGAPHLRSPALDVPFYQRAYLDLLAIVLFVAFIVVKLLYYVRDACYFSISKSEVITKKNK